MKTSQSCWNSLAGFILVVGAVLSFPGFVGAASASETDQDWWKGVIEVPGQPLAIVVVFSTDDAGKVSATIDIPIQQVKKMALVDVAISDKDMKFSIPAPANAKFSMNVDHSGEKATGKMDQHGMSFPVTMKKTTQEGAAGVGVKRPQEPKPPFPYTQRDVEYVNEKDQTTLAGTLTIPEGKGPHPAVLLITGSGTQDRDSTLFGHKPFWVIADHLSRNGIAVLRVDDRGIGGSTGATKGVTSVDLAGDVLTGVAFLREQPEIDPEKIGLIGHSEGGIIAPMVAAESNDVTCIVLLAGTALPGGDILNMQMEANLKVAGWKKKDLVKHSAVHRALIDAVIGGASDKDIYKATRELIDSEMSHGGGSTLTEEQVDEMTKQQFAAVTSPWMRYFLKHDPRVDLRKVKCPVFALFGSKDLQVPAKENMKEMKKALKEAGNKDVKIRMMGKMNHLFQEAKTGLVPEYSMIEQTISPKVLKEIEKWLGEELNAGTAK